MKLIEQNIWLEVADWEQVGVAYATIQANISMSRKSWSCITTQGKGKEMIFFA
jgi:hypothetical protein